VWLLSLFLSPTAFHHAAQIRNLIITSLSAGAQVEWQLHHDKVPYVDFSKETTAAGRVFVAAQDINALPPRGNGLLDPSVLTLDGTLREAGVNTAEYLPPELIYRSGRGEVFELMPWHTAKDCGTP
jgi:hypothetical protein